MTKNILSFVKALYFWPLFVLATAFWYSLILIINILQFFKLIHDPHAKCSHYCAYMWAKSIIQLMPGWKVHMIGRENIPVNNQPCVVVANHESIADIWAMYHLGIQFKWMSKIENFRLPLIGHALRMAKYVPVRRGSKDSHYEALTLSKEWIEKGISMLFFPEGTRTREPGKIQPFKAGAFKLACDTNVPLLPVAISGAGELIKKGSGLPSPGRADIKLKILPLVYIDKNLTLDDLIHQVREQIVAARASL